MHGWLAEAVFVHASRIFQHGVRLDQFSTYLLHVLQWHSASLPLRQSAQEVEELSFIS